MIPPLSSVLTAYPKQWKNIFDATCPLVTKVHLEVISHAKKAHCVILIGHKGHPEVEGTMGRYQQQNESSRILLVESPEDVAKLELSEPHGLSYVTQTTLSMDDTESIIDALRHPKRVISVMPHKTAKMR